MRILIICMLFIFGCKESKPETKEPNFKYRIAYNVLFDMEADNYEVFSMEMDGSDKKNITELSGVEWTYDAYDDRVYYISDKDTLHRNYFLYSMKADGSDKRKISDIRLADSWHGSRKNGEEIIVRPHRTVDTAFYIINNNGEVLRKLKPELDMFTSPSFSPDGKRIVFRGGPKSEIHERGYEDELYIMNDDGSDMKQITQFPRDTDTLKRWFSYSAGPPRWHPTENFISYQSEREGKYTLYRVNPDGSDQKRLTENDFSEGWHAWSPCGKYLAIEAFDKEQTQFDIMLMDWETKEVKKLTDTTYRFQQAPVFVKVYDSLR